MNEILGNNEIWSQQTGISVSHIHTVQALKKLKIVFISFHGNFVFQSLHKLSYESAYVYTELNVANFSENKGNFEPSECAELKF